MPQPNIYIKMDLCFCCFSSPRLAEHFICDTGRILHTVQLPGAAEIDKTQQINSTQPAKGENVELPRSP